MSKTMDQLAHEYVGGHKHIGPHGHRVVVDAFCAGYEAGRASVLGDTSEPVDEHGTSRAAIELMNERAWR